jgi:hypothetical protein
MSLATSLIQVRQRPNTLPSGRLVAAMPGGCIGHEHESININIEGLGQNSDGDSD